MSERPRITQTSGSQMAQSTIYTIAGASVGSESQFTNKTGATVNLTGATVVFDSAITSNDTRNFAIQLFNTGTDGTGTTAITSLVTFNTTRGDLAALTPLSLTLSTTAANLLVTAGQVVTVTKTKNGGGIDMPNGKLALQYKFV
jgi:hypothetical protein